MTTTTVEQDIQPANIITNLIDLIAAPKQALQRVGLRNTRSWVFPALLCLLGGFLYLWITLDEQIALATRQAEIRLSTLPPEQVEAARPMLERLTRPGFMLGSGTVSMAVGLVAGWILALGILYFGTAIASGPIKAGSLWSALVWTWTPFALRSFLQAAWAAVNNAMVRYPGLSYFVASGDVAADQRNPLYLAASQVDLFALWHLVLVYLLLRVLGRLGGFGAFILTLLYAGISVGARLLPVLVGSALSPAG
ncbi:MAG: hypothetical protein D6775_04655 [Caldilineae bacterium]|nr:MAG: hypothetical protein D6775_04655 [Caldilineae bacterium]